MSKINIDRWKNELATIIDQSNDTRITRIINQEEGVYILSTQEYRLQIDINQKWIGYDFQILGNKGLGDSLDTDLYSLDFDPTITTEIYEGVLTFLHALLDGHIYLSKNKLAICSPDGCEIRNSYRWYRPFRKIETATEAMIKSDISYRSL